MKNNRILSNLVFMLKYVLRYTPGYFILMCLFEIFAAVEVFLEFTYTSKYLISLIERGGTFLEAVQYMLMIASLVMIKILWAGVMEHYIKPRSLEKLHQQMQLELYGKAVQLDLKRYDSPESYNDFVWSVGEASGRMDKILKDIATLCNQVTRVLVTGVFFLAYDKVGIVFILVGLVINQWVELRWVKLRLMRDNELKPVERRRNYFNRIFYLNDYAKEIRLNPVADKLKKEFSDTNAKVYPIIKKYGKKRILAGAVSDWLASNFLMDVGYLGYLVYQMIVCKTMSLSILVPLYNSSIRLQNALQSFSMLIPGFQEHALYAEKIRTFLEFEAELTDGGLVCKPEEFKELSLEKVSFAYDGKEPVLKDISMTVHAGEKIAVVGYNGAGKTTLTKLLMRLYDVSGGCVRVNGRDIRDYTVASYRALYASVFQDYRLFAASIAENVRMDTVQKEHRAGIIRALTESGFEEKLSELPEGLSTQLGREFDDKGVNLSGGEAQKVAIARTFYHSCPVIILDEPSSALDPLSEYQLNQTMLHAAEKKTVIFISHRLSSTVMADKIYMLKQGEIIESGTHQELMERKGEYAQMFAMQAEKYMQA